MQGLTVNNDVEQIQASKDGGRGGADDGMGEQDGHEDAKGRACAEVDSPVGPNVEGSRDHLRAFTSRKDEYRLYSG